MPEPTRVLVVGGGAIAKRGHLPALRAMPSVQVVGLVDTDQQAGARTAEEFGIAEVFTDLGEALRRHAVDVVDVCAPTPAHYAAALEAIEQGKNVLIEKPLVTTREEILGIIKLAGAAPSSRPMPLVSVVQNYRYARTVRRALKRLQGGYLGTLVSVNALAASRFPVSWTRSTWLYEHGGVLLDFAPHAVDLLVLFAGAPPKRVVALGGDFTGGNMGFPNYAQVLTEFENGVVVHLDASWVTGTNMFTLEAHGTGGHVNLDVRNEYYQEYHGTYTPFDDVRDVRDRVSSTVRRLWSGEFFRGPLVVYRDLLGDFFAASAQRTKPAVTLGEALSTALILAAAQESLTTGAAVDCAAWIGSDAIDAIRTAFGG